MKTFALPLIVIIGLAQGGVAQENAPLLAPSVPNIVRQTLVSAVELAVYNAAFVVCSGNRTCDLRQDTNQIKTFDLDVPGLSADQQILTVDWTATNPSDLNNFTHLLVRRGDVHQVHIEIAGRGNVSAALLVTILVATRGTIPNAVVVESGHIVPPTDWFDSRNGENRVQCPAGEVMNGASTGLTNWWESRLRCTTLRLVRQ